MGPVLSLLVSGYTQTDSVITLKRVNYTERPHMLSRKSTKTVDWRRGRADIMTAHGAAERNSIILQFGPFLWPARRPETRYRTTCEIRHVDGSRRDLKSVLFSCYYRTQCIRDLRLCDYAIIYTVSQKKQNTKLFPNPHNFTKY